MMKQYRIGRVHQPWTNLDPPIRSPDYYQNLAAAAAASAKSCAAPVMQEARHNRRLKSIDISSVRTPRYLRYHRCAVPIQCSPSLH